MKFNLNQLKSKNSKINIYYLIKFFIKDKNTIYMYLLEFFNYNIIIIYRQQIYLIFLKIELNLLDKFKIFIIKTFKKYIDFTIIKFCYTFGFKILKISTMIRNKLKYIKKI